MDNEKTKCVICWQDLGSKKQLLHGLKCLRFDIHEKLKSFLHPLDFMTLYNKIVFPEPRMCNLCFVTIKQIPKGISKMQDFLGVPINLRLYKPHRKDWDVNIEDAEQLERTHNQSLTVSQCYSSDTENKIQKLTVKCTNGDYQMPQSLSATTSTNSRSLNNLKSKLHKKTKNMRNSLSHNLPIKTENSRKTKYQPEDEEKEEMVTSQHPRTHLISEDIATRTQHEKIIKPVKSDSSQENAFTRLAVDERTDSSVEISATLPISKTHSRRSSCTQTLAGNENYNEAILSIDFNIPSRINYKNNRQLRIARSIFNSNSFVTRSLTRSRSAQKQRKYSNISSEISVLSHSIFNHTKPMEYKEIGISKVDNIIHETVYSNSPVHHKFETLPQNVNEFAVSMCENSDSLKNGIAKIRKTIVRSDFKPQSTKINSKKRQQKEQLEETVICAVLRTDIPDRRSKLKSQKKIQEPTEKVPESVHDSFLTHKCDYPDCRKSFRLKASLQAHYHTHSLEHPYASELPNCEKVYKQNNLTTHHKRHMGKPRHYKCTFEGCNCTFVRKEKYELHLCTHSAERFFFCEKCGKQFGCQRYLDVHYKVHEKNVRNALHPPERTVACEVYGCDKKFTCRVYMRRHIISYHMGKRPRPVPGVFFTCPVEGCGKRFSLKSTMCRHNLLVHKGGDYKLNRALVRYPCTYSNCGRIFNRKNLLEKHMVMEHGKMPKQTQSQQLKEPDYLEKMCSYCGIVLTAAQLPRHKNIYHSTNAEQDIKESSPYSCHLEGCYMKFISQTERQSHVQSHIEKPPYKCEVDECQETFFLLKNLDNHLWNHSKKASACDVDGCSQAFGDQLQLAKHSKVHYDGKMKCPWRNCGSWFTAMGTLKQHFLAHSRSLKANFGWDFVCNKCDRVFSSKYGLKNHKITHEEDISAKLASPKKTEFMCEEPGCQAEFSQHKKFFDHFLHHFTNTPIACSFQGCIETFSTMLLQSKHGKSHYDGKYMCPWQDCNKMFASSFFQVKKHVYRHLLSIPSIAADRFHSCSQCDMVFRIQSNLKNHMAQHSEKSDYVCTVCGKKFHHNHLKRHMLTHRQEKPHACSHCDVRYSTVNGLKFHILQKHNIGKWPFKCSYCSKGFISSTEMRRHLPSHTKEKPFSCNLCGDTFATHTGYKGHMRKHTGQKYVCDIEGCEKVYTTPLSMKVHKAQHAGFSKMCQHCGKTFKNPYGHKCKASRNAKQESKYGPLKANQTVMSSTTTVHPIPSLMSVVTPVTHPMILTQTVSNHETVLQHADKMTIVSNNIQYPNFIPSCVAQGVTPGLTQNVPQSLSHVLPSHSIMQDINQPLDISKGTPINMTGEYAFNNCVVFWDSQNLT